MIQVENLTKYYGDLTAIKNVSFNVDRRGKTDGQRTGGDYPPEPGGRSAVADKCPTPNILS
ncbi:MAG: hypothetical protein E3J21_17660 [Anaerolineales bacterium]|nr:MAG: hypothetical protein E3J21_17660 [Anaerolineales bacterium]